VRAGRERTPSHQTRKVHEARSEVLPVHYAFQFGGQMGVSVPGRMGSLSWGRCQRNAAGTKGHGTA
jgi:hypothetical protein